MRGISAIVAAKKGSTWGTAVSVNAASVGIKCTDIRAFFPKPEVVPDGSAGQPFMRCVKAGNVTVAPTLSGFLYWANQHWQLICQLLGDDAVTGSGPYVHTMDLQSEAELFSTLCYYDGETVREIPSYMINSVSITVENAFMKWEIGGVGNTVLFTGQTNTDLSSVTYRTDCQRIPFGALRARLNDQSDGALDSGDNIYPASITINVRREISPEFVAQGVAEGSGEFNSVLPQENGFVAVEVILNFNEYSGATMFNAMTGETLKKLELSWTGPVISGGNYGLVISFPQMRVTNVDSDVSGPNRVPQAVTLMALPASTAPAGMTGITTPMRLVLTDSVSTAYDA